MVRCHYHPHLYIHGRGLKRTLKHLGVVAPCLSVKPPLLNIKYFLILNSDKMQYTDYIMNDQARRDREQQLVNHYNQQPVGLRKQNLWMVGMERHSSFKITGKEIFEILIGMGIVAAILVASIVLG